MINCKPGGYLMAYPVDLVLLAVEGTRTSVDGEAQGRGSGRKTRIFKVTIERLVEVREGCESHQPRRGRTKTTEDVTCSPDVTFGINC